MGLFLVIYFVTFASHAGVYNITNMLHDYGSITSAISYASNGDTIRVSTGSFTGTLYLDNDQLTIDGGYSNDCIQKAIPGTTIVVAGGAVDPTPVVSISNSVVRLSSLILQDGGVRPGQSRNGGGLIVAGGSGVTGAYITICNNSCYGKGGGVYVEDSVLELTHSLVTSNFAWSSVLKTNAGGGGIAACNAQVILDNTLVEYNRSSWMGGGVYGESGSVFNAFNSSSKMRYNNASYGAGVFCTSTTFILHFGADIYGNIATNDGGGLYLMGNATGIVEDSGTYIGNTANPNIAAEGSGGGVFVSDSDFRIQNSAGMISNQANQFGGAIYLTNNAHCLLDDVAIGAVPFGTGGPVASNGAGIAVLASSLVLTNHVSMKMCKAIGDGGAIFAQYSDVSIYDSDIGGETNVFANTAGINGGNLNMYYTRLILESSGISNGVAGRGGGLYMDHGYSLLSNCVFQKNEAAAYGGAVYTLYSGFAAGESIFRENHAGTFGGAFRMRQGSNIYFRNDCQIMNNTSSFGGGLAILLNAGEILRFENSLCYSNTAVSEGGGFFVAGGEVQVVDSSFRYNEANADGTGGGIYILESAVLTVEAVSNSVLISQNKAATGGGISLDESARATLIATNTRSVYLTSNTATNFGGGAYMHASSGVFSALGSVRIGGNTARYGGGLYVGNAATATLSEASGHSPTFYYNTATEDGGAIYVTGTGTVVSLRDVEVGTELFGNTCNNYGGGIYAGAGAVMTAVNTRVQNNQAGSHGGGYYGTECAVTFCSDFSESTNGILPLSQIRENQSGSYGGGFYSASAAKLILYDTLVFSNHADARGGGMYLGSSATSLIYNALIVQNEADTSAQGVRVFGQGNTIVLLQSTLSGGSVTDMVAVAGGAQLFMTNCIVAGGVTTGQVVNYSEIEGGYPGTGNINQDPQFKDDLNLDYRLLYGTPCTNLGTTISWITNDCMGARRPVGSYDMGAYEYDGSVYDSDDDSMVDVWEAMMLLDPLNAADALSDNDSDGYTNAAEYVADTDPLDSNDYFHVEHVSNAEGTNTVTVLTSSRRVYALAYTDGLTTGTWYMVDGQTNLPGSGGSYNLLDANAASSVRSYRATVALP